MPRECRNCRTYLKQASRAVTRTEESEKAARGNPHGMALRGPSKGVTRRRRPDPEVIRLTAGQLPKLADAVEALEDEPVSQVRTVWPGRQAIIELFVEAGRRR